jgi:hypothetical protein
MQRCTQRPECHGSQGRNLNLISNPTKYDALLQRRAGTLQLHEAAQRTG